MVCDASGGSVKQWGWMVRVMPALALVRTVPTTGATSLHHRSKLSLGEGTSLDGGHGGQGTQLPTTFRDPNSGVGYPGPGSTKYWVAGGGGGGSPSTDGTGGAWDGSALLPGGPHAGASPGSSATPATTNSGSGGGGGGNPQRVGSNGGSGIVLIAYPT